MSGRAESAVGVFKCSVWERTEDVRNWQHCAHQLGDINKNFKLFIIIKSYVSYHANTTLLKKMLHLQISSKFTHSPLLHLASLPPFANSFFVADSNARPLPSLSLSYPILSYPFRPPSKIILRHSFLFAPCDTFIFDILSRVEQLQAVV